MKQHITYEQFDELSLEQQLKMHNIFFPNLKDYANSLYENSKVDCKHVIRKLINLMNIGKMIEIIGFYESSYAISYCEDEYCITLDRGMGGIEIPTECLCDSLWIAVKEVVNDLD